VKTTIQVGDLVQRLPQFFEDQPIRLVAAVTPDRLWVQLVGEGDRLFAAGSLIVLSKANDSRDLDPKKYFK